MRKVILVAATLLCSGLWAIAQTSPSDAANQAGSAASQAGQAASQAGQATGQAASEAGQAATGVAGGMTSIDGCLGGSSGNYTLTDKSSGTTFTLAGDTSKLGDHVGQEVRITGSAPSASAASSGGMSNGAHTFNVASVSKVASTCSSGQ